METSPKFLRRKDAAEYLKNRYGVGARRTLDKLACVGGGPRFVKFGGAACYTIEDLDAWMAARTIVKDATHVLAPDTARAAYGLGAVVAVANQANASFGRTDASADKLTGGAADAA